MTSQTQVQAQPKARLILTPTTSAYLALTTGLVAASFAAVMMRLALDAGVDAAMMIGTRLLLAAVLLTPFVIRHHRAELRRLPLRSILWVAFAGLWMACNLWLIALSLEHTSILVSQVIVNSSPLWVALLETFFLKAHLSRKLYYALMLTMFGGVVIALASTVTVTAQGADALLGVGTMEAALGIVSTQRPILGAILALLGALGGSVNLVIGRNARQSISNVPYIWLMFTSGGLVAFAYVALMGIPVLGYSWEAYQWLLVLTLGPHLIGHSAFSYALGHFPATLIAISTQAVTISAAVIAFLLFAEVPSVLEVIGSLIIAFGVMMAIRAQRAGRH